jgi:hypothetical protein
MRMVVLVVMLAVQRRSDRVMIQDPEKEPERSC